MTTTTDTPRPSADWRLWAVGVLALLWNGYGCYDYWMSNTAGDVYLRQAGMSDVQITYFHGMPSWMTAVWAVGVWGGLAGAVLLLLRMKLAYPVFAASLAAYVLSLVYSYVLSPSPGGTGAPMIVMNLVILAGCVFFLWYARLMAKRGVLR